MWLLGQAFSKQVATERKPLPSVALSIGDGFDDSSERRPIESHTKPAAVENELIEVGRLDTNVILSDLTGTH